MYAVFVRAEEMDACLFEQAGHEVQIGLAVLNDVLVSGILQRYLFQDLVAVLAENAPDDLPNGHVGEDAAVRGEVEEPKPRPQGCLVHRERVEHSGVLEAGDMAVEVPEVLLGQF